MENTKQLKDERKKATINEIEQMTWIVWRRSAFGREYIEEPIQISNLKVDFLQKKKYIREQMCTDFTATERDWKKAWSH